MANAGAIRAGRAFVELFADNSKLIRGLKAAEAKVLEFGNKMRSSGMAATMAGIFSAMPAVASLKVFSGFDDQMRAVQAVTGSTGEAFEQLTATAKLLGRTTSFTAQEVASGMLELGRAGFKSDEIDAAIAHVMNLARATQTEIPRATEIAGNALRGFGLDATDMGRVTDVLATTANNSAQTLDDLGEAFKYVAPIASVAGMSLEDTAKVLGTLANFGIKGSLAGTALKNILTRMADPDVQTKYESLGVKVKDAEGNLRNVADVLKEVGVATANMPNAEKLTIFKGLFDMRALAGGAKLSAESFEILNKAIDNAAGASARTAKTMDSGIGGSLRMLYSAIEGVAIAVGEALAPSIQKCAALFTKINEWSAAYLAQNKELVIIGAKAIAAITGIGVALLAGGFAFTLMGNVIGVVVAALNGILTIVPALAAAVTTVIGAIAAMFTPLGLIIALATAGIVAAGYLLWDVFTETVAAVTVMCKQLCASVSDTMGAIGTAIARGDIQAAMALLWASLKLVWVQGTEILIEYWYTLVDAIQSAWTECVYAVAEKLTSAWYGIQSSWADSVYTMSTLWSGFTGGIIARWKWAEEGIAKGIGWIIAKMQGIDPNEMTRLISDQYADEAKKRESDQTKTLANIQQRYNDRQANIKKNKADVLTGLEHDKQTKADARKAKKNQRLEAANTEVAKARQQYEAAMAAAKNGNNPEAVAEKAAANNAVKAPDTSQTSSQKGMNEWWRQLVFVNGASSKGTFSAWEAAGGQVDNWQQRIAMESLNLQKQIRDNTAKKENEEDGDWI